MAKYPRSGIFSKGPGLILCDSIYCINNCGHEFRAEHVALIDNAAYVSFITLCGINGHVLVFTDEQIKHYESINPDLDLRAIMSYANKHR